METAQKLISAQSKIDLYKKLCKLVFFQTSFSCFFLIQGFFLFVPPPPPVHYAPPDTERLSSDSNSLFKNMARSSGGANMHPPNWEGGGRQRKRSEYSFAHKALADIPVSTDFQKIVALASCFFVLGFQVTSRLDNLRSIYTSQPEHHKNSNGKI